jgi:hypothetical protein
MTKIKVLIISVLVLFSFCTCQNTSSNIEDSPSQISVISENDEINHVMELIVWNNEEYDEKNIFLSIMSEDSDIDIPHVKIGESIDITFNDTAPDTYELKDYILNDDGSQKYADPTIQTVPIEFDGGAGSFILERNWAVGLSSDMKDYAKGATIRGFKLVCSWGDNMCEYAFIIKTDG